MFLGCTGGIVTGVSIPLFNVLFGQILDKLNGSGSDFTEKVNMICIAFVAVAGANIFSGFFQVSINY